MSYGIGSNTGKHFLSKISHELASTKYIIERLSLNLFKNTLKEMKRINEFFVSLRMSSRR